MLNLASPLDDGLTPEQLSVLLHETLWCASSLLSHTWLSIASEHQVQRQTVCVCCGRTGMPVRVLDLSGTALSQGSVVGSAQLYGLRQAAQRAGGSVQALLMARCSLASSASDWPMAW